jgi:hypothetical protein
MTENFAERFVDPSRRRFCFAGYFQFKREEFLQHHHKRSNVESMSSMMKRKFGDGAAIASALLLLA